MNVDVRIPCECFDLKMFLLRVSRWPSSKAMENLDRTNKEKSSHAIVCSSYLLPEREI